MLSSALAEKEFYVLKYILHRLLAMIPVLLGILLIVFTLMFFSPGNPARQLLGANASEEAVWQLEEQLGLHDGFFVRFFNYLKDIIFHFDFGKSYSTGHPVMEEVLSRFPYTLKLAAWSAGIAIVLGLITGIISAVRQYSTFDNVATIVSLIGVSMPNFWQGLINIIIFSVALKWLPSSGSYGPEYWILPAVTLGTSCAASVMRTTRSSMLEVIRQDYIRMARSKGQSEFIVIMKHAFKNALIPIITVIGNMFGSLLGGSVLVESVFAIPGLGKYMIDAISERDYPVVLGSVLFLAVCFSLVNLLIDIIYCFIDPRVIEQYKKEGLKKKNVAKEAVANEA